MRNDSIPKISIIVPTYNAESFLHRCIDSLVYQTLEEIEILIVDNLSEDGTWDIMEDYAGRFPDKVRIFKLNEHTNGPGAGRNLGLAHARAEYIGFADSDDYFDYKAFELMYEKAVQEKCDLVYVASYDVRGTDCKLSRNLPKGTREEIMTIGSMVFWNKLVHRSLFDLVGKVPEDMVFEDLAYCTGLVSHAQKIGYIDTPLYYYIIREDSGVNTMDPERVLKSIKAEDIALSLCNPEYLDYFADSVAMRNCNNIRDRWQFTDSYIEQLIKLKPYLRNNEYFKKDKRNYARVQKYYRMTDSGAYIPRVLYVNGFGGTDIEEFVWELQEKAFWNGGKICVLTEENCDLSENEFIEEIYQEKMYEQVAQYFALRRIYEHGGVYLDSCIEIENPLNFLLHLNAFFAYLDRYSFSDKIFGAIKNHQVIQQLLDTYLAKEGQTIPPLSERIKEMLIIHHGMVINGKTDIYDSNISVFAPEVFVLDKGANVHMACHNFKEMAEDADYITVKRSSLL